MLFARLKASDERILKILATDDLLALRSNEQIAFLQKHFNQLESASKQVISELNCLIIDDPQLIIDLTRNVYSKDDRLTTLLSLSRIARKESLTPIDKVDLISKFYEISSIFKLGAFLISKRRSPIENFEDNNKLQILKFLAPVGLDKQDREHIRLIRNSSSHLLKISNDEIHFPKGDKLSIAQVAELLEKTNKVFSWWATLIVSSIWFNPKFGILVVYALYTYIIDNKEKLDEYHVGLKLFFPDLIKEKEKPKPKSFLFRLIRKYRIKAELKIQRLMGIEYSIYERHFEEINPHLIRHSLKISAFVDQSIRKLNNKEDVEQMSKFRDWLNQGKPTFEMLMNEYKKFGKSFLRLKD